MSEEKWKKVESDFWKPEKEGEEIIGVVMGTTETSFGDAMQIKTEKGIALVNYTALNDRLTLFLKKKIRIVYKGMKKSEKGRDYYSFDIYEPNGSEENEESEE